MAGGQGLRNFAHDVVLTLAVCAGTSGASFAQPVQTPTKTTANDLHLYVESGIHHSGRAVAFSGDGKFVATGSLDRTIKIWDLGSSRELVTLPNKLKSESLIFLPTRPVVLSANEDGTITVWDTESQLLLETLKCDRFNSGGISLADAGRTIVCGDRRAGALRRWRSDTFEEDSPIAVPPDALSSWLLSPDARMLFGTDNQGQLTVLEVGTWRKLADFSASRSYLEAMAFAPGRGMVVGIEFDRLIVWRWSATDGRVAVEQPSVPAENAHSVAFNADESRLAYASESGDIVILDTETWKETKRLTSRANRIEEAGGSPGSPLLFVKVWTPAADNKVFVFDLNKGVLEEVTTDTALKRGQWDETFTFEGMPFKVEKEGNGDSVRIKTSHEENEVFTLVIVDKRDSWVAVTPDGRFDTNIDLTASSGTHWIEGNRAYEPLPLEMFMRDYYEPRLIPRLLSCTARRATNPHACEAQFKAVRPLSTLNRVRPNVRILSVKPGSASDEAVVEVEALAGEDPSQRNGKTTTKAYDLRLFRDGQLVGEWPTPGESTDETLASWRDHSQVLEARHQFKVRLPSTKNARPVSFTAYAFNDERVKSDTAEAPPFFVPVSVEGRPRHAYVLTVGINGYKDGKRDKSNLSYAVNDANALAQRLKRIHGYETTTISLISEAPYNPRDANLATKAAIHREFAALAAKVRPDDFVIVSFASHGYTTANGQFYVVPADARVSDIGSARSTSTLISATELSAWLREVDAGTLVMVIDTCHAAGSVDVPGFKPGPMGDRGFGQLAYDKRMQILAATQGDDLASEFPALRHGVLTYTLVDRAFRDGGVRRSADGRVAIREWLRFAEKHTPQVYNDAIDGKIRNVAAVKPAVGAVLKRREQTPALFDFQNRSDDVFIDR